MTPADGLAIIAIILSVPALMLIIRQLGGHYGWNAELRRKLVHVSTGCLALSFPWLFSGPLPVLLLIGLSIPLMMAIRMGILGGMRTVLHGVERQSYGDIYLGLAIAITFLRGSEQPVLYLLPILVITLSDTAAALIGTSYGRRRFSVEDGIKSIEGVVVFFVVTWLASLIMLVLMTDAAPANLVLISLLVAAFCALVEVDSWRGLDNLFVPIGAMLLLSQYLNASASEIVLAALVFLTFLVAVLALANDLRLSRQAARAYAILLFLMMSIVGLHNAALPLIAIGTHLAARLHRPCDSPRPDFDTIFLSAAVSLFWMAAGDLADRSLISLFNLTFASAALGFLALALSSWARIAVLPAAVLLGFIVHWVIIANLPFSQGLLLPPWAIATGMLPPATVALIAPERFRKQRSLAIFALAMIVPIILGVQGVLLS